MAEQTVVEQDLEALAATDPQRAHEEARRRVAADPDDEQAALELRNLIRRFPPPHVAACDPLEGAAPDVQEAASLLGEGKFEEAEILLRRYLGHSRNDPQAMRLMAKIALETRHFDSAYKILRRSLEIDRTRADNWADLGQVIHRIASNTGDVELIDEAIATLDQAARLVPSHLEAMFYKAAILIQVRRLDEATATLEELLQAHPDSTHAWTNYGYLRKTLGHFGEAVAAYRTATALDPTNSEAWWNQANLKRARAFDFDIEEMEQQIGLVGPRQLVALRMAIANAYDRKREFAKAAEHLREGSRLRFKQHPNDLAKVRRQVDRAVATFTPDFFRAYARSGNPSDKPIFIIGMPRSGSTLIEQILASHPQVEGTEELFAIHIIENMLLTQAGNGPELEVEDVLTKMAPPALEPLGTRYLLTTQFHRRTDRPHFTDKNPSNWRHVGLIHTILPNAKIIDARRNPMDCGFGNYIQHYNLGANYSYDLTQMGKTYCEYLRLMRHFDKAMPGMVHRVIHEELVDNFEDEVRRLLDYLELPFEDTCLRFHETERAVHTPSSEQVRQPINRSGFGRWRNYEQWLGELKEALGESIDDWRR